MPRAPFSCLNASATLALALLGLSGCSHATKVATPEVPAAPNMEPGCGADQLGAWIGQPASEANIAAIAGWHGDKPMRVLHPGMAVTMDFRPDRLNVKVGEDGKIEGFSCT